MTSSDSLPTPADGPPVASARHTTVVLVVLALVTAVTVHALAARQRTAAPPAHLSTYLSGIAAELGLVYFIWRGIRTRGVTLASLSGGPPKNLREVLSAIAVAALLWGGWWAADRVLNGVLPAANPSAAALLPHGLMESVLWVLLSLTAGFAEELLFRGYLMRQLHAFSGNRWLALGGQALIFGVVHGYQGVAACIRITVFGLLFGLVAMRVRNLRGCILAHAWTDIAAGLLR